jgi:DNA-directed RNA polymerase III subunit RPC11
MSEQISRRLVLTRKELDDVMGGEKEWANVDQVEARCPGEDCDSKRAYYKQAQLRGADEPMTIFYKCVKCGRRWNG